MPAGSGAGDIALPDVIWPDDLFDDRVDQVDISMFLNDFIGTGRSAVEILRGLN